MIFNIYFLFYKVTHLSWLSAFLAKTVYGFFFIKYLLKRAIGKHRIVNQSVDEAMTIINEKYIGGGRLDSQDCHSFDTESPDESMDLSVIVPVYNYVNFIEKNIESVLDQKTRYHFQLILVDDGSTDGSATILKKYADNPRVRLISQENRGIAGARNTGLNAATGKYVMFVDCDDIVEEDIVETLLERAYADDCDIVMCAHNYEKERDGKVIFTLPNIYPGFDMEGYANDAKILKYSGVPWGKIYKRELWTDIRFVPGYWYEDTIIQALLFMRCKKFAYVPEICYRYRRYDGNFSRVQCGESHPKNMDMFWLMDAILKKYSELDLPKNDRFETMLLKHLSCYYWDKISGLDSECVDALFTMACELYDKYGTDDKSCKLPYMLRVVRKALKSRDIEVWKNASQYQK